MSLCEWTCDLPNPARGRLSTGSKWACAGGQNDKSWTLAWQLYFDWLWWVCGTKLVQLGANPIINLGSKRKCPISVGEWTYYYYYKKKKELSNNPVVQEGRAEFQFMCSIQGTAIATTD